MTRHRLTEDSLSGKRVAAGAADALTVQGVSLGQVAELLRATLTKEFGVVPPNINTSMDEAGGMVISAVDPDKALNLQVTLVDLNISDPANPEAAAPAPLPGTPPAPPAPGVPGAPVSQTPDVGIPPETGAAPPVPPPV